MLKGYVHKFPVSYETIDVSNITNIHKCLMKNHNIVRTLGFLKQALIVMSLVLLRFVGSLTAKYASMNNQPCVVRPMLADLNPDKLYHYPFIFSLDRCHGSCNTAENPFGRICIPNKMEEVNLKVFNMIKEINKLKKVAEYISYECRFEFVSRKCSLKQKWNNGKCQYRLLLRDEITLLRNCQSFCWDVILLC